MHLEYVTACNNKCKWRIKIFTVLHFFYQLLVNQNDHLGTYWCTILHTGWRFRVGRWQVSLSLKPCQRKSETPACGASSVRFGQQSWPNLTSFCGPTDLRLRFSWLAGVGLTLIVGLSLTRQSFRALKMARKSITGPSYGGLKAKLPQNQPNCIDGCPL